MTHDDEQISDSAPDAAPGGGRLGDAEIARIVRDVVDGWSMPPVRLDQPGWRDRIRSPRARRTASIRGWTGRLGQAAGAAVALTVGAALLGVWLTRPPGPASQTAVPSRTDSANSTPHPHSTQPLPSQLPKLFVEGDVPSPSHLVVSVESAFAVVDLATGTIGKSLASGQWGTDVRRSPDGSLYCICLNGDSYTSGSFTHFQVVWKHYDAAGIAAATATIGDYTGGPDPQDAANLEQAQHVAVHVTYASDPRLAYVGWTLHAHPVWKSGFVVVDVRDGSILQRIDLPDSADGTATSRTGVDAPRVVGSIGPGRLAVARPWYTLSPPISSNPTTVFGASVYAAAINGDHIAKFDPLPAASGCGGAVTAAGTIPGSGFWLGCVASDLRQVFLRRVADDGHMIGDTKVQAAGDLGGDASSTSAVSPDGRAVFLWDPIAEILTRVDLATGDTSTGTGQTTAALGGPLSALGRWLTPTAAAKVLLSSGIAISPDGSRVYALGISLEGVAGADSSGSAGVFVFDTSSMAQVAHWNPTADFVSLAVSKDGRIVYAAGSPQFDANGTSTTQAASITAFDAASGSIRLIAGQLGSGFLLFPSTIVR